MISETQQEQASLHALGLLDADEAAAFERESAGDAALAALVRDLRDVVALALTSVDGAVPPAGLKGRILACIAPEGTPPPSFHAFQPAVTRRPASSSRWLPWALAACLLGCCAFLAVERGTLLGRLDHLRRLVAAPTPAPLEALSTVAFLELEPTPDAPVKPRAAVLWDAREHRGVLRITQLAPPAPGKDYQLWAVESARKEPVNAGVVRVNAEGHADVAFQPDPISGDNKVVALAISLEQAGGSPTNQGPILFLGKL